MAKPLEFYIWVANDTLIGCNVQMALPTASPASLLPRGVLSSGPSLCMLAHRVILQRRRKETRMRAEEWRDARPLPLRALTPRAAEKCRDYSKTECNQEKVLWGRSCQEAMWIRGLGISSCCRQPGLPINSFFF